jgi:hypothetical protein
MPEKPINFYQLFYQHVSQRAEIANFAARISTVGQ